MYQDSHTSSTAGTAYDPADVSYDTVLSPTQSLIAMQNSSFTIADSPASPTGASMDSFHIDYTPSSPTDSNSSENNGNCCIGDFQSMLFQQRINYVY